MNKFRRLGYSIIDYCDYRKIVRIYDRFKPKNFRGSHSLNQYA